MSNWKKCTLAAVMITAAVFVYNRNSHKSVPPDFRDAPSDTAIGALKDISPAGVSGEIKTPDVPGSKGSAAETYLSAGVPAAPVEWVTINGGKFTMGTYSGERGFGDTKPTHDVFIKTFDMSKTDVTVEQYAECVIKGGCKEPDSGYYCNWGKTGRQLHPVNCVDFDQAQAYAKFKGARLPSESEWEYAATSGGKNQKYPWGNDEPTCDSAVMDGNGGDGCGKHSTWPVCSKTAGNTEQGLCDMAGNVWQWVQDKYEDTYYGAPADGSAVEDERSIRVLRGGSFRDSNVKYLRAEYRRDIGSDHHNGDIGFRLVRASR